MKKKTIAAGLLCGLLLAGITQKGTAYAASPSLSASADTGSVAQGDYVNVDVKLGNNPSISTLGATLNYDSDVLKYDGSTWNSGFSGSDMQMASDTGSEVNLSVVCDDSYAEDGTVVTVRFQAVKDSSSIPVTLALRDMADADLAAVSDCTVASTLSAPQAQAKDVPDDSGTVDLEDPSEASGIRIVDEEVGSGGDEVIVANAGGSTKNAPNVSAGLTQGSASGTGSGTGQASSAARLDSNYKTGIGLGTDAFLVGAAAFGILALVLAIRRHREEE